MWEILTTLKSQIVKRGITIDNEVFRLHYRYTLLVLVVFALIITSGQYLGDPIECFSYGGKDIPHDALNLYCWVQTTFILPKALGQEVGVDVIAQGVDTHLPGDEKIYLKYYQWVSLFLLCQAAMFYCTRFMWKSFEGGKLQDLASGLCQPITKAETDDAELKMKQRLASYLFRTRKNHTWYFYKFFLCETLNFLHIVLQIYLVDVFLGGTFTTYGSDVVKFMNMEQENRTDPMIKVFPRITKCTFHKFGPTGNIQTTDVFCVLPLNILNEKVFVFLWFWFVVLGLFSGIVVLYRVLLILVPELRRRALKHSYGLVEFDDVVFEENLGFWLLMKRLAKNTDHLHFQDVLDLLAEKLENEKLRKKEERRGTSDGRRLLSASPPKENSNLKVGRSNSTTMC